MQFRPCIDIHNGKVKQIVGGSLSDQGDKASENFVSEKGAGYYASFYKEKNLPGGHIILLNKKESSYYNEDIRQAREALAAYPGGFMVGGGITEVNAKEFIEAGASHVIVTSYVFQDGKINYEHLHKIKEAVGKEHLVLDLSCRKKGEDYYIVTDRWQKFTKEVLMTSLLEALSIYCDEFLIHAVDVEGKANGIEEEVIKILAKADGIKATYAGGVSSYRDIEQLKTLGDDKIDVTIGSALDIFGGNLELNQILLQIYQGKKTNF